MADILTPHRVFVSTVFVLFLLSDPVSSNLCNKDDKKVLLAIGASFNGLSSWNETIVRACCDWSGVDCDVNTGRVTGLRIFADPSLAGTIPSAVGDLPYLTDLILHKLPLLTGSIPPSFTKLTRLSNLDLSWNSLSGPIPSFLYKLTSLTVLNLSFNKFTGSIPPSLATLPNLDALHLDRNSLTGPIPDSFASYLASDYASLFLSHNNLSGPIPASLGSVNWWQIDLSRNKLTGDARVLIGSAKQTGNIDISRNMLSFDLTNVKFPTGVQSLDMNHNMIYGEIPAQVNQLSNLGLFNVSYNRLCGQIPPGNVTAKFDQYSYFHNKCLCGPPLAACK